jgi:hypothetical protein
MEPTIRCPIEEPTPAAIECLKVSPRLGAAATVVTVRTGEGARTGAIAVLERGALDERGILLNKHNISLGIVL